MGAEGAIKAGEAFVELVLKDSKFSGALEKSLQKFEHFGKSLSIIGGVVTASFAGALEVFGKTGAELGHLSEKTGASVEFLSQLKFAADQTGTSIDAVAAAFKGFAKFSIKGDEADKVLKRLNLSAAELKDKTQEERFLEIADALSRIDDPAERAGLAMKVLGKASFDLLAIIAAGPGAIKKYADELKRLGGGLTAEEAEAAKKWEEATKALWAQLTKLAQVIGESVAPALTKFMQGTQDTLKATIDWAKAHSELLAALAGTGGSILGAGVAMQALAFAVKGLVPLLKLARVGLFLLIDNPILAGLAGLLVLVNALAYKMGVFADNSERAFKRTTGGGDAFSKIFEEQNKASEEFVKQSYKDRNELLQKLGKGDFASPPNLNTPEIGGVEDFERKIRIARGELNPKDIFQDGTRFNGTGTRAPIALPGTIGFGVNQALAIGIKELEKAIPKIANLNNSPDARGTFGGKLAEQIFGGGETTAKQQLSEAKKANAHLAALERKRGGLPLGNK